MKKKSCTYLAARSLLNGHWKTLRAYLDKPISSETERKFSKSFQL